MFFKFLVVLTASSLVVWATPVRPWGRDDAQKPLLESHGVNVPQYVLDYAPVIYLHSEEQYAPVSMEVFLNNTFPTFKKTTIADAPSPVTLENLQNLNDLGGSKVHLSTKDDFTTNPDWILGHKPDTNGTIRDGTRSVVIVNRKSDSVLDAYYIFFYGFNRGIKLFGLDFLQMGNHVADWEHVMIRFVSGVPQSVFFSQHGAGAAYTYAAVEKRGLRVVGYAGNGTHATWATPGTHSHIIPYYPSTWGAVVDYTDAGHLWDPLPSARVYSVTFPHTGPDESDPTFTELQTPLTDLAVDMLSEQPAQSADWLYFEGHWGDPRLPDRDPRQETFFFGIEHKQNGGPTGPMFKDLNRESMCKRQWTRWWPCVIRSQLLPGS